MDMRETLRHLMAFCKDDAYALQEKSEVPQPTTQRFLSGTHGDPRSATVRKWAKAYGITESQLRGDVELPDNLKPSEPDRSHESVPQSHAPIETGPIVSSAYQVSLAPSQVQLNLPAKCISHWEELMSLPDYDRDEILATVSMKAAQLLMSAARAKRPPDPESSQTKDNTGLLASTARRSGKK